MRGLVSALAESSAALTEQGTKFAQNVVAGVAGFVIPVLWFGMDWQGTASKEVAALQSRQQYLATLAEQRCKPEPVAKPQRTRRPAPRQAQQS
jgi:hypothetical protein